MPGGFSPTVAIPRAKKYWPYYCRHVASHGERLFGWCNRFCGHCCSSADLGVGCQYCCSRCGAVCSFCLIGINGEICCTLPTGVENDRKFWFRWPIYYWHSPMVARRACTADSGGPNGTVCAGGTRGRAQFCKLQSL